MSFISINGNQSVDDVFKKLNLIYKNENNFL